MRTKKTIWTIEGERSGYSNPASANQRRIVHRKYTTIDRFAEACKGQQILYSDGTTLRLIVTPVIKKELPENPTYVSLIDKCVAQNVWEVDKLK